MSEKPTLQNNTMNAAMVVLRLCWLRLPRIMD